MSYLGRGLEQVDNISKLDNITFNGGTTYALTKDSAAFTPISSNAILISIDGVVQQGNFSVSGTNIVFNFSPTSSNTCDFIMHYGTGVAFTPADSSITKDKTNFVSTSSSAGLEIKGDGTTDGTLQLNCSQNSHGVKIKSPAHSAGQSYTLTLPTTAPASNKMLQTDGSGNLSFVDAPSGKMVLLQSASTQTNASTINFENLFDKNKYSFYRLVGWFRPVTDGSDLNFRWRSATDALSQAEYYGVVQGKTVNGSGVGDLNWNRWGGNFAKITNDAGNNAYNGLIIDMVLRPRFASGTSTTNSANITFQGGYWQDNSGSEKAVSMHGHYTYTNSSADMDNGGFILYPSSGDFDEFEYVLYGITQS